MAVMILPVGSAIKFGANDLTEHNRSEISVDIQRIETSDRMANGALRKYVIADKKKWSVSWEMVPSIAARTVDGKWGGSEMHTFYLANPGVFTLQIKNGSSTETYNAVITEFNYNIVKRTANVDAWNITMTFEEA